MKRQNQLLIVAFGCLGISVALGAQGAQICLPIAGQVRLLPDASCAIKLQNPVPGLSYGPCFSASLRGPLGFVTIGSGAAGFTNELLLNAAGALPAPAIAIEAGVQPSPTGESRTFFTARSALTLSLPAIGSGKILTADAGVIGPGPSIQQQSSAEQLLITGGDGAFANASGTIFVRGNIVGSWAPFNGQICVAR
jgi:hypothetical protein